MHNSDTTTMARRRLGGFVIIASVLVLASCAPWGGGPWVGGPGRGFGPNHHHEFGPSGGFARFGIARDLDLTERQEAKFELVRDEFYRVGRAVRRARERNLERATQIVAAERLDTQALMSLVADNEADVNRAFAAAFEKAADFHASLTPEQRRRLAETLRRRADRW